MRRMTKEERLAKEELTKTQVLNLSELERVANYERRTSKKPAAILAILGVMCITLGLSYNNIVAVFSGTKEPAKNTISHKEVEEDKTPEPIATMSCQYTNFGSPEGLDTTVEMTLIFNNGKLGSYTKVMNIKPTAGQEAQAAAVIPQLLLGYQSFEPLSIAGYKIVSTQKDTGFETIVSLDLKELDPTQLNMYHESNVVTKAEFTKEDTKETVLTKAEDLGYICQ